MGKKLVLLLLLLSALITACSSAPDYEVSLLQPIYLSSQEVPFIIKVQEEEKPAAGLDITAEFEMKEMNHDSVKTGFKEGEPGIYTGSLKLPMAGKYKIYLTIKNGGKESEKVMEYEVKQAK